MAKAIMSLLIYAGLRAGELLSIKLNDVDMNSGRIEIIHGKGKKNRTAYPAAVAMEAIGKWLDLRTPKFLNGKRNESIEVKTDYLFALDSNRRISYQGLCTTLNDVKRIAGLVEKKGLTCHAIRHGFAKRMMENNANIREIQAALVPN